MIALIFAVVSATSGSFPLLKQYSNRGFVPPSQQMAEFCDIYADHVDITLQNGEGALTTVSRPMTLTGDIEKLIVEASHAHIERWDGPTDGPALKKLAVVRQGDMIEMVDLAADNGDSRAFNTSVAADILRRIIDQVCPAPEYAGVTALPQRCVVGMGAPCTPGRDLCGDASGIDLQCVDNVCVPTQDPS